MESNSPLILGLKLLSCPGSQRSPVSQLSSRGKQEGLASSSSSSSLSSVAPPFAFLPVGLSLSAVRCVECGESQALAGTGSPQRGRPTEGREQKYTLHTFQLLSARKPCLDKKINRKRGVFVRKYLIWCDLRTDGASVTRRVSTCHRHWLGDWGLKYCNLKIQTLFTEQTKFASDWNVDGATYSSSPKVPRRPLGSASPWTESPANSRYKKSSLSTSAPCRPACFPLTSLWSQTRTIMRRNLPDLDAVVEVPENSSPTGSSVLCPRVAPERRHPDRDVSAPDPELSLLQSSFRSESAWRSRRRCI